MNIRIVALTTTGVATATGASLGYYFWPSSGKTLKTRYPSLKVPAYNNSLNGVVDNSFWWGKADEFKKSYLTNRRDIGNKLLNSMEEASNGKYNFRRENFNLNNSNGFVGGDGEVAQTIAKYCEAKWDSKEEGIENYPEIMKELCT